jgi:hypothetical protein
MQVSNMIKELLVGHYSGRESPVNIIGVIFSTLAFNRQGSQVEDLIRDLKR